MTADLEDAHRAFRDQLVGEGLFLSTGVDGLYGKSNEFEQIVAGLITAIERIAEVDQPKKVSYPPLIPKSTFDTIGYLRNFPQLCGLIYSFTGGNQQHTALLATLDRGEPYADELDQTEVSLTPACCYPVYPSLHGGLPEGVVYETSQYCFRHEPSVDPMRLQAFRQHENIAVGTPEHVLAWRELWLARAPELLGGLGLNVKADFANDPFFGRAGRLMSVSQREQQLKIEFLVPVFGEENPTACASVNYHQDHFGELFHIETSEGVLAHSACIGFGLERCAVALLAAHGLNTRTWPSDVRTLLWP